MTNLDDNIGYIDIEFHTYGDGLVYGATCPVPYDKDEGRKRIDTLCTHILRTYVARVNDEPID